jgi:hypothetical protein
LRGLEAPAPSLYPPSVFFSVPCVAAEDTADR